MEVLIGAPPSGSSTSTTPGEFDSSSLEGLIEAPPRGVQFRFAYLFDQCDPSGISTGTALNFSYGAVIVELGTLSLRVVASDLWIRT